MKKWDRVLPVLCVVLILLVATWLRIAVPSLPYNSVSGMHFLGLLISIYSDDLSGFAWAPWDGFLMITAILCTFVVPVEYEHRKLRKFFLRPLAVILVFLLATPLVNAEVKETQDGYRALQKQQEQQQRDKTFEEIAAFLEDADVAFAYNTNERNHDSRFEEEFPELLLEHPYISGGVHKIGQHHTDYVLIDYETQRVGVIYTNVLLQFYEIQLEPAKGSPSTVEPTVITLEEPGAELAFYCLSEELDQYTDGIRLTMADGSIYSISGLSDENNFYLGLQRNNFEKVETFPAP